MNNVLTGLDFLREYRWKELKGYKLGLLANQASLDSNLNTAREIISRLLPGQLKVLFGPQHGYAGQEQDNMIETYHSEDRTLDIPIYSLYSETREPLHHMLEIIDILLIDLQDVGTRVYTFASTMLNCLRAASRYGKKVIILDRPNPLGGEYLEGNLLRPELYSFVGSYSFPMRHGLTMGEMARIFNHVFELGCNLEIIPMHGWTREMLWNNTGLRWFMPSTNMPIPETAFVYPGQVIWEGTNISEGRGTCRPFEIFGAPFFCPEVLIKELEPEATIGCCLQEYSFRPVFNKWQGELCHGFMIHVLDRNSFQPYLTSIGLLRAVMKIHEQDFEWKDPPYEYEFKKKPIDLIMGDVSIRNELESGTALSIIKEKWLEDLKSFDDWRKPFLIYS
ncbi:MAG TPA: DUF1343 domain-containing protein [Desulfobacteraceae bacterium]|nr:DUF1343 domain-containing protein [Desulfobacteraceae bacterium]HPQ27232.1 DUF1343 domain-containing protein [Desulfobacteraceae bacterium]